MSNEMETEPFHFQPRYFVYHLKPGSRKIINSGQIKIDSSITLITGKHNVLVGTGRPSDKEFIVSALREHSLSPDDIEYIICTQGDAESVGNLNLFPKAMHVIGYDMMREDELVTHDYRRGDMPFEIEEDFEILATPGMSHTAVTVMVANSNLGTAAIACSLFHSEMDLDDSDLWSEHSIDPDEQQKWRIKVLQDAHFVVPRYGPMFQVPDSVKSEMQIVMTPTP